VKAPSRGKAPRAVWCVAAIGAALLAAACDRSSGSAASAASAASTAAPSGNAVAALAGTWRQLCQPYLPGDGASDITYSITLQGAGALQLAGVAKDYKNTSCAGAGTVIATPKFEQKIVGSTTLDGITVFKLVDADAPAAAPEQAKSLVGIDKDRLRFGDANGARDSEGFPARFEKPADAYNR
jgi:hypothetical protein